MPQRKKITAQQTHEDRCPAENQSTKANRWQVERMQFVQFCSLVICNPNTHDNSPQRIKSGGELFHDRKTINVQRKEYFDDLPNCNSILHASTLKTIPQQPIWTNLTSIPDKLIKKQGLWTRQYPSWSFKAQQRAIVISASPSGKRWMYCRCHKHAHLPISGKARNAMRQHESKLLAHCLQCHCEGVPQMLSTSGQRSPPWISVWFLSI